MRAGKGGLPHNLFVIIFPFLHDKKVLLNNLEGEQ